MVYLGYQVTVVSLRVRGVIGLLSLTDAGRFRLAGCSGVFFFTVLSLVVSSSCRFCLFCVGVHKILPI